MVAPAIPIAGAAVMRFAASPWGRAAIGTVGGLVGGFLMGGSKKKAMSAAQDANITTTTKTLTSTYAPSYQYDYSRMVMSDSPGATMKKVAVQTPSTTVTPQVAVTPSLSQAQEQSAGTDFVTLALIGGGALVAYGFVTKK